MDARKEGAYCHRCQQEVIDFTNKAEAELNAILAAGTWTGCGRFYASQIGPTPLRVAASASQRSLMLARWRKGAAAALLLVGLWQVPATAHAAPKQVSCLLPQAERPPLPGGDPNYLVSAVLLDTNGQNFDFDVALKLVLPNGDSIAVNAVKGFFSVDLTGKLGLEEMVTLFIPQQTQYGELRTSHLDVFTHSFALRDGHNLQLQIPMTINSDIFCVGSVHQPGLADLVPSVDVIRRSANAEPEIEPLFRTRTPAEKAAAKAEREARRAERMD